MEEQQQVQQQQGEQHPHCEKKRVIAFAADESEFADHAFEFYVENIMQPGDYVCCIHVPELYDLSMASPAVVDQLLRELTCKVEGLENKYREKMHACKLSGKFRTGQGKAGQVICDIAKAEDAVMIISGSRGLGKVRRTFLGSVSDYILHHSHVPVLICRPKHK